MRKTAHTDMTFVTAIVAAALAALFFCGMQARPQAWLYQIVRQATKAKIEFETRNLAAAETAHFVIKYEPVDADIIPMVAEAAEQAYVPVTTALGHSPDGKTLIVIYHNRAELNQAFGWSGDKSAMGVYWGGVIQLLSPRAWMKDGQSTQEFIESGPMVHEFTHLVFDQMTNGNYPRWVTEGLAQYVEYKVNNYEWITQNNRLDGKLYTTVELDSSFDDLSNESLAYRESLAAIRYIAEVHGEDKLDQLIKALATGRKMPQAVQQVLGMDYASFDKAWREWAAIHIRNNSNK